jgi:hypothetical protein
MELVFMPFPGQFQDLGVSLKTEARAGELGQIPAESDECLAATE